jgi:hypothetical protein
MRLAEMRRRLPCRPTRLFRPSHHLRALLLQQVQQQQQQQLLGLLLLQH